MQTTGGWRVGDDCTFESSDYFLPQAYVDEFTNEVQIHTKAKTLEDGSDILPKVLDKIPQSDGEHTLMGVPPNGDVVMGECSPSLTRINPDQPSDALRTDMPDAFSIHAAQALDEGDPTDGCPEG